MPLFKTGIQNLNTENCVPASSNIGAPALGAAELAEYVGTFKGTTTWEVYLKEEKLFVKNDGTEYLLTTKGDRKFSFGKENENELVFVPGKSGRIEFIFSELYSAKRVKA